MPIEAELRSPLDQAFRSEYAKFLKTVARVDPNHAIADPGFLPHLDLGLEPKIEKDRALFMSALARGREAVKSPASPQEVAVRRETLRRHFTTAPSQVIAPQYSGIEQDIAAHPDQLPIYANDAQPAAGAPTSPGVPKEDLPWQSLDELGFKTLPADLKPVMLAQRFLDVEEADRLSAFPPSTERDQFRAMVKVARQNTDAWQNDNRNAIFHKIWGALSYLPEGSALSDSISKSLAKPLGAIAFLPEPLAWPLRRLIPAASR